MQAIEVTLTHFHRNTARLIRRVARGETFRVVAYGNEVVAVISPPPEDDRHESRKPRRKERAA